MRIRVIHNEHDGPQVLDADTGKPLDLKITKVTVELLPQQPAKAVLEILVDDLDIETSAEIKERSMKEP